MTTPPQTPRSTASSVVGGKRDRDASESEREGEDGVKGGENAKKRRIAPTLVGGMGGSGDGANSESQ
jgi:hypothetical protein